MNVGIIGAGFFGEKHAQAIAHVDGLRVVAASRHDANALDDFTMRYGGTGYVDHRGLLRDEAVDAVVIATPHATHEAIAVEAALAGKHVLLEKPMATSLEACDRILDAVEQAGVTLAVGHVTQFSGAYRLAKEMLDAGELGDVVAGLSTMRKRWHEPNRRWWHLDRSEGGGVLLTGGLHAVDRLTWLAGAKATSVAARLQTRFHDQAADDAGVLFIRYANGATGVVFSIGYDDGAPRHDTELTCTKGILRVHSVEGVHVGRGETMQHVPGSGDAAWMDDALVEQWRAFQKRVEGRPSTAVTGGFARHVMEIVFAAEASSVAGTEVAVG